MPETIENPSTLLLIDWQKAFNVKGAWGGNRNNPGAEDNAIRLLKRWRDSGWPVVHVVHDTLSPDGLLKRSEESGQIKEGLQPVEGETLITKRVNSAFIGTDLDGILRRLGAQHLTICGLTTEHCVSTSTRMAANLGYRVTLAGDACAAFDKQGPEGETIEAEWVHRVNLASLDGEFCTVARTGDLLA